MLYPSARLLPHPTYRLLTVMPALMQAGWLVRRTSDPQPFDQGLLRADQLCSPREKLTTEGLSMSLLGQFEVPDVGWQATTPPPAPLDAYWLPPASVPNIEPAEALYRPAATWSTYALPVAPLHQQILKTQRGDFECHVCHLPTCRNYWHFELRFRAEAGQGTWLHETPLSRKQQQNIGNALRDSLLEGRYPQPVSASGQWPNWPAALYCLAG